jgi:hypothetical protein
MFAVKMSKHSTDMNEISSSGENLDAWAPAMKKWEGARLGTIIGGALGVLGLAGFGISFAF